MIFCYFRVFYKIRILNSDEQYKAKNDLNEEINLISLQNEAVNKRKFSEYIQIFTTLEFSEI